MSFERGLALVLANEGGYSHHPADRGGATMAGITQATYDVFCAAAGEPRRDVRDITPQEVATIYRRYYWDRARCDQLPEPLDVVHFDAAVNHGVVAAAKLLQRTVEVDDDGIIGPQTLAAVQASEPRLAAQRYLTIRLRLYADIVARDHTQVVFLRGWIKRIDDVQRAAA